MNKRQVVRAHFIQLSADRHR